MSSRQFRRTSPAKAPYRPRIEALEDRDVPASISVAGSTVTVTGDNTANRVTIRDNGDGDIQVSITGAPGAGPVNFNNITRIRVNTDTGNDRVNYTQTGARTRNMDLRINLGRGNDEANVFIQGDIRANRTLSVLVDNPFFLLFGQDNDRINIQATNVNIEANAAFNLTANGGTGTDRVDFNYSGIVNGPLNYTLDGGLGDDSPFDNAFIRATVRLRAGTVGFPAVTGVVRGGFGNDSVANFIFKEGAAGTGPFINGTLDGGPGVDVGSRTLTVTNAIDVENPIPGGSIVV